MLPEMVMYKYKSLIYLRLALALLTATSPSAGLKNLFHWSDAVNETSSLASVCLDGSYSNMHEWRVNITCTPAIRDIRVSSFQPAGNVEDMYIVKSPDPERHQLRAGGAALLSEDRLCIGLELHGIPSGTSPGVVATWDCMWGALHEEYGCPSGPSPPAIYRANFVIATPPPIATTATTTPTTTTPTTTTSTATTSTSVIGYDGDHILDPTQILMTSDLEHATGLLCYNGTAIIKTVDAKTVMRCVSLCIPVHACTGVNYWSDTAQCDLVRGGPGQQQLMLVPTEGCRYLKVIYKL